MTYHAGSALADQADQLRQVSTIVDVGGGAGLQWLLAQRAAAPHDTIVVVSHGDVIRSALVYFLGMPIDMMLRMLISPASISTLEIDAHGAPVTTLNGTAEE